MSMFDHKLQATPAPFIGNLVKKIEAEVSHVAGEIKDFISGDFQAAEDRAVKEAEALAADVKADVPKAEADVKADVKVAEADVKAVVEKVEQKVDPVVTPVVTPAATPAATPVAEPAVAVATPVATPAATA